MERKEILCLDCNAILLEGVNHMCPREDEWHFISKPGVEKKHIEDIQGFILHVSQNNSSSQIRYINSPAAFSSSVAESPLNAEYLQNFGDGANKYLENQRKRHPNMTVMNISTENIFDSSFHPRHQVSAGGNDRNSFASDCLVQSRTSDTGGETTNHWSVTGVSSQALEVQNDGIWSNITKSIVHNNIIKPVWYDQDSLQGFDFSVETFREEIGAANGFNNRALLLNNEYFEVESRECMEERNILCSTNILEPKCISKNFDVDLVDKGKNETDSLNLQRSPQVISETCDAGGNELADNDVPLESESFDNPIAGPSHRNVKDYVELRDGYYMCPLCGTSYSTYLKFDIHYRIHSVEKPYACDMCPKQFSNQYRLNRHRKTHSEKMSYPCDICEKRFFSEVELSKHQLIHSFQRPHACDKCPKRFTQLKHLTYHLRAHTGEKPFPCDLCDKRFSRKDNMKQHRQTHFRHKILHYDVNEK